MANLFKRKEGRNSLIFLAFLVLALGITLVLPPNSTVIKRDREPVSQVIFEEDKPVTLLFVGDIMLSRLIGSIMVKNNDWRYPFLGMADFLTAADVTFGNLEGPLSNRGIKMGSIYSFRDDPKVIEGLAYAGFDVLSLANNHIWDYGSDALVDTMSILELANIDFVGAGLDYEVAHKPLIKEVGKTKIAYLGYTNLLPESLGAKEAEPAIALLNTNTVGEDIKTAKSLADIVVVSIHWGNEYETKENEFQKTTAHALIDAGADLIIGHHPHVRQPLEQYGNGFIIYSLGNFVFDQNFSEDTKEGGVLKVIIKNKKIDSVKELKIRFNESYQPFLVES